MVNFRLEDRKLLCYRSKAVVSEYSDRIEKIQRLKASHNYYEKNYQN